jgi:hypothetical protein
VTQPISWNQLEMNQGPGLRKTGTLVSVVSDGVYIFGLKDDNTLWYSHPNLPPILWQQLLAVPEAEIVTEIGVTFWSRDLESSDPAKTFFIVTKTGNLWFFDGIGWIQENTP